MAAVVEKIEQLFSEIKKGNYSARDEFFEIIWINMTTLAHYERIDSFTEELDKWATDHATEHPDFTGPAYLAIGSVAFLSDNFERSNKYLTKAKEIFTERKDDDGLAVSAVLAGFKSRAEGDIDKALKHGLPAMEHLEHSGNYKMFLIIGYYWIGGIYVDTGHPEEALVTFQKGLHVDYPAGIQNMAARLTNGIAGAYMKQKKYNLALEYYQKALDLCDTTTEYTFRARGLTDLGDYYVKMGNYPEAIRYNEQALAIRREMKIQNGIITNLMNLGDIYNKQRKCNEAIDMLTEALKVAEEIGVKVKMYQIHLLLSDIYLGMGDISASLAHHKAFHEIREEVNHADLERRVKNQVQIFQAQQTQKENAIIKAQKLEIERKNIELQETIDELTLARINKKARAFTLSIAIVLFIFQDRILEHILHLFASDNYWLSLFIKVAIIFSLEPVNKAIEHYLLRRVIKKKRREVLV